MRSGSGGEGIHGGHLMDEDALGKEGTVRDYYKKHHKKPVLREGVTKFM
jgi:hypothetical protein